MAYISQRGAYWRAEIRRRGHKPVYRTFDTKQQAQKWARRVEGEMDAGMYTDRSESERTTLREALERYRRDIVPEKRHPYQENRRIDRWIHHDLAYRTLASLRGADFAKYRDERRLAGRAENTIRLELQIASHLFEIARKEWSMEGLPNPLDNIRKPTGSLSPTTLTTLVRIGSSTVPRLRPGGVVVILLVLLFFLGIPLWLGSPALAAPSPVTPSLENAALVTPSDGGRGLNTMFHVHWPESPFVIWRVRYPVTSNSRAIRCHRPLLKSRYTHSSPSVSRTNVPKRRCRTPTDIFQPDGFTASHDATARLSKASRSSSKRASGTEPQRSLWCTRKTPPMWLGNFLWLSLIDILYIQGERKVVPRRLPRNGHAITQLA
ncbi:hypothetical protein [Paraburkholderia sp. CI3]|uniref:hypothetical protein n=1 Tax=Paraburkholderia sp. CI3 TaxID=2991060 RepID=UPI003D228AC5